MGHKCLTEGHDPLRKPHPKYNNFMTLHTENAAQHRVMQSLL